MKNKLLSGVLACALVIPSAGLFFGGNVSAQTAPSVVVNDVEMEFSDQKPIIDESNRTLMPVRFMSQVFDIDLEWDRNNGDKGEVVVEHGDYDLEFQIGESHFKENGERVDMDTAARITDQGRTVVPLRAISDALDISVAWNGNGIEIDCDSIEEHRLEWINELNSRELEETRTDEDKVSAIQSAISEKGSLSESVIEKLLDRAAELDLDIAVLLGLADVESNFNPDNVSHAGALGLFQLMPGTARNIANEYGWDYSRDRVFDAEYNIKLATQYFRDYLDRYDGNVHKALTAYNRGSVGADNYIASRGTGVSGFSQDVMEMAQVYESEISD